MTAADSALATKVVLTDWQREIMKLLPTGASFAQIARWADRYLKEDDEPE